MTNTLPASKRRVKRSYAACICGLSPRTLRRYELTGALTPIKVNCRLVVYPLDQVIALADGKAATTSPTEANISRGSDGRFSPVSQDALVEFRQRAEAGEFSKDPVVPAPPRRG